MVILTGSWPPDACGVGDYALRLRDAMTEESLPVLLYYKKNWSFDTLKSHIRTIRLLPDPVINLQYPTEGYGYSIVPQLLTFFLRRKRILLTLHEFSRKSLKGRVAIFLFFLSADWVVFTTGEEQDAACKLAPWLRNKSSVVQIGSTIPFADAGNSSTDLVYFGLIRPGKGLEQFAEVLAQLKERSMSVRIIGQTVSGYESYANEILQQLKSLGAELELNAPPDQVAAALAQTRVVLLPFPDGISPRRSSALAAMANGALLVTTPPKPEFVDLSPYCVTASSTEELANVVRSALEDPKSFEQQRLAGKTFARNIQWPEIARQYQNIVRRLTEL